ncbi:MAG: OmpA family protein, partial [Afipia sp.]|nr:OmpA family protein [Afipia sp.]
MIGTRISIKRGGKDEAEKPFWISFADLMTALMVLFLVVMAVALLAVTKTVTEKLEQQHRDDVEKFLDKLETTAKAQGIDVDRHRLVVDFGDRAQFASNKHTLTGVQESVLRTFVPEILLLANDDLGKRVLKRIVVEGYADKNGGYLLNLNLSLQRSQRVVCVLLAEDGQNLLSESQKKDV